MSVELLLGGRIGLWALEQVDAKDVSRVVTHNPTIAAAASERRIRVDIEDVNLSPPTQRVVGLSMRYPKLLSFDTLSRYSAVYNLHPSLLPWGRGAYGAFWAIWAGEPAGASLHAMTSRLDGGPIADQVPVEVLPFDTCGTLLTRVAEAERLLFNRHWPCLAAGEQLVCTAQEAGGSYHSIADYNRVVEGGVADKTADDLVRLIRALTFETDTGLEVELGGARFQLQLVPKLPADGSQ